MSVARDVPGTWGGHVRLCGGKALRRLAAGLWGVALVLLLGGHAMAFEFGPLVGKVWGSGNRNLIVILHGDGGPGRYDGFAKAFAARHPGTTLVTLLRPGYRQGSLRSPGSSQKRDHYTAKNNDLVAATLASMKKSLRPRRLIAVGHSGGSGQLGTIIGRHGGIVDVALLVSCPCDVPNWRVSRKGTNNWLHSQSPLKYVKTIPRSTKVIAITGKNDGNTKVRFPKKYVEAAKAAGKNASHIIIPRANHDWRTLAPSVEQVLTTQLK